jgi:probable rRNA maturation factor
MKIDLTNLVSQKCDERRIASVADFVMSRMELHPDCELSISLVDEEEMSSLHLQWMDEPGPTDVLSFPMDEIRPHSRTQGPGLLGDVILCPSYATKQADDAGHSLQEELELLTVHGVLHLLGYDHREEEEKQEMFSMQDTFLSQWRARA